MFFVPSGKETQLDSMPLFMSLLISMEAVGPGAINPCGDPVFPFLPASVAGEPQTFRSRRPCAPRLLITGKVRTEACCRSDFARRGRPRAAGEQEGVDSAFRVYLLPSRSSRLPVARTGQVPRRAGTPRPGAPRHAPTHPVRSVGCRLLGCLSSQPPSPVTFSQLREAPRIYMRLPRNGLFKEFFPPLGIPL